MRPAQMKESPNTYFRPAVFICDEYQSFASVGEDDPTGDEKSFALHAPMPVHPDCCNPIHILIAGRAGQFGGVAGAFADASHPDLSILERRRHPPRLHRNCAGRLPRSKDRTRSARPRSGRACPRSQAAPVDRAAGASAQPSLSRSAGRRSFTPRDFTLLGNCQAICLPYDGAQSLEPRRVYLKPHYLPLDHSYWRAKEAGQI